MTEANAGAPKAGDDAPLLLMRDVLDQQIMDRDRHLMNRVDGIALEVRPNEPPRVVYLELGLPTLAARWSERLGAWARRLARRWGGARPEPVRIPWSKVRQIDLDLHVDERAEESPALAVDRWLYARFISKIPGAGERKVSQ
jgi:hypothetical protein